MVNITQNAIKTRDRIDLSEVLTYSNHTLGGKVATLDAQALANKLLDTQIRHLGTDPDHHLDIVDFTAIYFHFMAIKSLYDDKNMTQIILDKTVCDLVNAGESKSYDFSSVQKPMWISLPFDSLSCLEEEDSWFRVNGAILIPVETILMPNDMPSFMWATFLSSKENLPHPDGFILQIMGVEAPLCSINIPRCSDNMLKCVAHMIADMPEVLEPYIVPEFQSPHTFVRRHPDDVAFAGELVITSLIIMNALERILQGEFVEQSTVKPFALKNERKAPKARSRGKRLLLRRQSAKIRSVTYIHKDSIPEVQVEPKNQNRANPERSQGVDTEEGISTFTYTPRNTRSHYKMIWVTLDYAEGLDNDDIIDIQSRTRQLKNGPVTKDWALVKVWFEHTYNPDLDPTVERRTYKA